MIPLCRRDVHVWRLRLEPARAALGTLAGTLSADEHRRAGAFACARDRDRFVARRGLLRLLLARYVDCAPADLAFAYGPHGKPELAVPSGDPPVTVSWSHSSGLGLYALARGRRVGVDVEARRDLPEAGGVADLCFSPRERSALAARPRGDLTAAVLRGWTVKEAYVKAVGAGLSRPLDSVEVGSHGPPALLAIDGDPALAAGWSVHRLAPDAGYVAAVVVEGHEHVVRWPVGATAGLLETARA